MPLPASIAPASLDGYRIAVFVEHKYIPEEITSYQHMFQARGATVELYSRLWYSNWNPDSPNWKEPQFFFSDVDPSENPQWEQPQRLAVPSKHDVSTIKPSDFAAVIMAANYPSVRLRWSDIKTRNARELVQSAPVPRFFADAMNDPGVVVGALCHGLWVLTPFPELLAGRNVTCHTVVMADILNCGSEIPFEINGIDDELQPLLVCTDNRLVTGYSKKEVIPFIEAIEAAILKVASTDTSKEDME